MFPSINISKERFPRLLKSPGKSSIFFLENSRTWKVLENHFGPGKSWKLKLKVLECPGKISLKFMHFSKLLLKSLHVYTVETICK